jgi:pyruvate carboxylase
MIKERRFRKILVANRGEIAIRIFRACTELGIRTVAIYSKEDSLSLHRYKADEAYLVGEDKGPVEAYLDIDGIIEIAKKNECDAIHPGYGFLSENADFARACERNGIVFIGPTPEHLEMFGDKVSARRVAIEAGVPVIPGTEEPVESLEEAREFAKQHGFPLIIKAVSGGGGRGMRVVRNEADLEEAFARASSEAKASFGNASVYMEKFLENPKHIEVQILADQSGNVVHLFERDCSIQRRHQKVVEVAPSFIDEDLRYRICDSAVQLMRKVGYKNAGTVEFLLTRDGSYYFIEVNPRIQVEHTITELITGVDIVHAQIRIAEGQLLSSAEIGIPSQEAVTKRGYAIQCRVTTEDPENNFMPDTGRVLAYRSASGFGIRLDGGNGFTGARITPYYDSLLVKISSWAIDFNDAAAKMKRSLQEFRIRGVKTNLQFLENVVSHPDFLKGEYDTSFIEKRQELFNFKKRLNRGTKLLQFIANSTVNVGPGMSKKEKKPFFKKAVVPEFPFYSVTPEGTKQLLDRLGADGLSQWIQDQKRVLITDTTFRDGHQSLFATRARTYDLLQIAEATAKIGSKFFSLEMWGGATFDVSMRFLKEDPWERLEQLREKIPNILFQMLLRGANAVGYSNYPDNVVKKFIEEAGKYGIDVFRIFDSLNWLPNMTVAIDTVRSIGKVAEATICYTGDILDPRREKYNLKYYINMAKELERAGAHILGIKDMAGLLKPYAAYHLIKALKEEIGIPIHLHTHDTSGNGVATLLMAAEAGVDIVDCAISSMSGLTSQPSLNALVAALEQSERATGLNLEELQKLSDYWEVVREYYQAFEKGLKTTTADVYLHEMPGGQYTNLRQQAESLGLGDRWEEVKKAYAEVNRMLGDIVKVTPSSKMVGDLALFMVQNNLTEEELRKRGETLDFPASVVDFFMGYMGQPPGGFPEWLQRIVLKGREPLACRPGEMLEPVDFDESRKTLTEKINRPLKERDLVSYALYPQVFLDMMNHFEKYHDVSVLDTPTFFYGMRPGEEITVEIEDGKTLMIKLIGVGGLDPDGTRTVYFELNGQPREVVVRDESANVTTVVRRKADQGDIKQIGALMSGNVVKVLVEKGDKVKKGEHLIITEAMKMETQVQAPIDGVVKEILVQEGDRLETGDLMIILG